VQFEATVPTVADRIAQTVVAMYLEPRVDHGQTFSLRFASHRIGPADRGDGGARRSPTC
jgi:hypothetical protein